MHTRLKRYVILQLLTRFTIQMNLEVNRNPYISQITSSNHSHVLYLLRLIWSNIVKVKRYYDLKMFKLGWEIRYLNIILYSNEIRWVIVFLGPFLSNRSWNYFDCYESTPEISCLKPYFFRCIISKLTTIQWRQKDKSHTCALNRSLTISVIFKKKEVHKLYTHDINRVLHNIYMF